jgi:hypothetical protein
VITEKEVKKKQGGEEESLSEVVKERLHILLVNFGEILP